MKFRWSLAPAQPALAELIARECQVPRLTAQCLLNRGQSEPDAVRNFLEPRLKDLRDPFLIPNMAAAVDRLLHARERAETVVIFGDYDVDGVSSTALLLEVLQSLGWKVRTYLPHRFEEGYGLSREGVSNCLEQFAVDLLLAVDCGSTAVETIAWMRERGIDVLVLDHHQVSQPPPAATALVNPQLAAPGEPSFRELCSAGLAFKLAHALVKRGRETGLPGPDAFDLKPLLDLVALGTIADIVPLRGENRILVRAGLRMLDSTQRPGLVALKEVARVGSPVQPHDVGFLLGPRLNAAGRLENAAEALELVLAPDPDAAGRLAASLDSRNRERQQIERNLSADVIGRLKSRFDPAEQFVIVEGGLYWHIGVVGIVASRVLREFYRPTIIIGGEGKEWRGSGRSIEGFDLAAALRECDELLIRHGGHAMAAGISIHPDRIDDLRERLNTLARCTLSRDQLLPPLLLDALVEPLDLKLEQIHALKRLAPFGQENPAIKLVLTKATLARAPRRIGREGSHVKLQIAVGRDTWDAVWWNGGDQRWPVDTFDLAFTPEINEYNGRTSVQLKVLDWRPHRAEANRKLL
jgi:single-stranded-DNA-specific exonuclease